MVKRKTIIKKRDLSDKLVLPKYISYLLGYDNILTLFNDLKNTDYFYNNGISSYCETLLSNENKKISDVQLKEYDNNIKNYVDKIKRSDNFKLKYYQYLAVLFNEIYLDKYFSDQTSYKINFKNDINSYVKNFMDDSSKMYSFAKYFKSPKIAYWMATGSGKTIMMHINYLQFIYYNKKYNNKLRIDNYILITPSEYLSNQHLKEFEKSGIHAMPFNGNSIEDSLNQKVIKVIDINKLKLNEDKTGSGVSIDISSFGSHNLILVDEGHKGYKSDERKWLDIRNRMSEDGFTYEYSATFGQAIADDEELIDIYSKAIIFDYSYNYFYKDGYGKEFFVINLDPNKFDEKTQSNLLLLGNAISYAEQLYIYEKYPNDMDHYNVDKPLWMFVGSKVNVSDKRTESDIYNVIDFIRWLITTDKDKIMEYIENIITGKSGIVDENGNDIFGKLYDENLFKFFRDGISNEKLNYIDIYNIIFEKVLKNKTSNIIYLSKIKNADGEIGISIGNENNYFGLIDIGDRENFLKNIKINNVRIIDDNFSKSLFEDINKPNKINIIIGAKKFIEGWDTYRASTISLLYIGKSEGSQIIQLFGRGVRLKGINNSLKRSDINDKKINTVQTLYIYGIKADYLRIFRDMIKNENALFVIKKLKTKHEQHPDLPIIRPRIDKDIYSKPVYLEDENISLNIDLIPKAIRIESNESTLNDTIKLIPYKFNNDELEIINWNDIYIKLLDFKNEMEYYNLVIDIDKIKDYIYKKRYDLYIPIQMIDKDKFDYIKYMNDIILEISKKYVVKSYNNYVNNKAKLCIDNITENDLLNEYIIKINDDFPRSNLDYIDIEMLNNIPGIKVIESKISLYMPLLSTNQNNMIIYTVPEGLNEGEKNLVYDLGNYLDKSGLKSNYSFYLLRNGIKGKGIGIFVNNSWIYPDFILWMIDTNNSVCRVIFLEPHGLTYANFKEDPKLNLYSYLKSLDINKLTNVQNTKYKQLLLDSFVISVTSYNNLKDRNEELQRKDYLSSEKHIVFAKTDNDQYNYDYVKEIFDLITN